MGFISSKIQRSTRCFTFSPRRLAESWKDCTWNPSTFSNPSGSYSRAERISRMSSLFSRGRTDTHVRPGAQVSSNCLRNSPAAYLVGEIDLINRVPNPARSDLANFVSSQRRHNESISDQVIVLPRHPATSPKQPSAGAPPGQRSALQAYFVQWLQSGLAPLSCSVLSV